MYDFTDDLEAKEENCDICIHNKYLYTKADETKVFECNTHTCEFEEIEE